MEEYVHQFCELSYQGTAVPTSSLFKDLFYLDSIVSSKPCLTNLSFLEECIMVV